MDTETLNDHVVQDGNRARVTLDLPLCILDKFLEFLLKIFFTLFELFKLKHSNLLHIIAIFG